MQWKDYMCSRFIVVLGVCLLAFSNGYTFKLVTNKALKSCGRLVVDSKLSPISIHRNHALQSTIERKSAVDTKSKKRKPKKIALDWYFVKSIAKTIWNSTIGLVLSFIIGKVKGIFEKKQVASKESPDKVSRTIENIKHIAENDEKAWTADEETIAVTVKNGVVTPAIVKSDQIVSDFALATAKEAVVRRLSEMEDYEVKGSKGVKKGAMDASEVGDEPLQPVVIADSYTANAIDHAKKIVHFSQASFVEDSSDVVDLNGGDSIDSDNVTVASPASDNLYTTITAMKDDGLEEKEGGWAKIKSAGKSGIIAYVLTELSFWTVFPLLVVTWQKASHQEIDLSQADEQAKVLGLSAGFVTMARAAVPARIALALSLIPFVDKYINKNIDSSDKDEKLA